MPAWAEVRHLHCIPLNAYNVTVTKVPFRGDLPLVEKFLTNIMVKVDYRITILCVPKLTQDEYEKLYRLRADLEAAHPSLRAGVPTRTSDEGPKKVLATEDTPHLVEVPAYYWGDFSIYVYRSDDGFSGVVPTSVGQSRDRVLRLLEETCSKYKPPSSKGSPESWSLPKGPL